VEKAVMRFNWFKEFGVDVIVVFDGKAQELKKRTILGRER
jgi:hypothetical protein